MAGIRKSVVSPERRSQSKINSSMKKSHKSKGIFRNK